MPTAKVAGETGAVKISLDDPGILAKYDPSGSLVQVFPRGATWPVDLPAAAFPSSEVSYVTATGPGEVRWRVLSHPVVIEHHQFGQLRYARPLTAADKLLSRLLLGMLVAIPLALAATTLSLSGSRFFVATAI